MAAFTLMTPGDGENDEKLSMTDDADRTPLSLLPLFAWETNTSHDIPLDSGKLLFDMLLFAVVDDNFRTA